MAIACRWPHHALSPVPSPTNTYVIMHHSSPREPVKTLSVSEEGGTETLFFCDRLLQARPPGDT